MRRPFLLISCLLVAWSGWHHGSQPLHAQSATEAYDWVEVRISGTQNVNRNFLHEFWRQGVGGEVSFATPFYIGYAEVGGTFHRYAVDSPTVPGFDAVFVYAGWGLRYEPIEFLQLESGLRVGNYRMAFDEATFSGVKNESELGMMVQTRVAIHPLNAVAVHLTGSYLKAYTFQRLKLWYVSGGVSFRLHSPPWLKNILR